MAMTVATATGDQITMLRSSEELKIPEPGVGMGVGLAAGISAARLVLAITCRRPARRAPIPPPEARPAGTQPGPPASAWQPLPGAPWQRPNVPAHHHAEES